MSDKRIRSLLETRLKSWADSKSLPVAFENVQFTDTSGTYLRAFMLPATTRSQSVSGDHRQYTGIFQINIVGLTGTGAGAMHTIADGLSALFPMNLRLTDGTGFTVQIITPVSEAAGILAEGMFTIPVSFQYRADTTA